MGISGAFGAFDVIFSQPLDPFSVGVDASTGPTMVSLTGGVISSCFGGVVTLSTPDPLLMPSGSVAQVFYQPTGAVVIDLGQDASIDQTLPSCVGNIHCPA